MKRLGKGGRRLKVVSRTPRWVRYSRIRGRKVKESGGECKEGSKKKENSARLSEGKKNLQGKPTTRKKIRGFKT